MKFALMFAVLLVTILTSGCNAFRGVGQDIENAGAGIQRTVDKND